MAEVQVHGIGKFNPFVSLGSEIDGREEVPAFLCGVATVLGLWHRTKVGASAQGCESFCLKRLGQIYF